MTSLILENADLNRLFPKCRPRGVGEDDNIANNNNNRSNRRCNNNSYERDELEEEEEEVASCGRLELIGGTHETCNPTGRSDHRHHTVVETTDNDVDMIDLERDTSDRCRKRTNGRKKSSSMSRRQSSFVDIMPGANAPEACANGSVSKYQQQQQSQGAAASSSSSSSTASGRSEDAGPTLGTHYGSDHQGASQQDDSGTEESPVYILTSAKGDRSYKLRDSRIIEIAGGREVFSQSRGKVAARKPRFLAASNSIANDDSQSDNKLSLKKNNKSPNRQSVWELRSRRCGETRKQRVHREVTETVFSSEVHSVRRNPSKSILDYDSPTSNRGGRLINYDSILNSNNVEHNVARPKSITDLEYGFPKNCIDSLNYQSSNHNASRPVAGGMSLVNDGEVVVFDDIDDNWQNLRLDLSSVNAPATGMTPTSTTTSAVNNATVVGGLVLDEDLLLQHHHQHQGRTPPEPLSSSICSSPSPTTTYHRNSSDFFKTVTPASDCEPDFASPELNNHKGSSSCSSGGGGINTTGPTRIIGELPLAQYSNSPRRYGASARDNGPRLPSLLSSPSSVYVAPRPGFPQRVLPTTPSQKEEDSCSDLMVNVSPVLDAPILPQLDDPLIAVTSTSNAASPTSSLSPLTSTCPLTFTTTTPIILPSTTMTVTDNSASSPIRFMEKDEQEEEEVTVERKSDSPLKQFVLPSDNLSSLESLGGSTFDYLYEFSETRKVLEEFFKCPEPSERESDPFPFQDLDYELRRQGGSAYVGQRLATVPPTTEEVMVHESPKKHKTELSLTEHENNFLDLSVGTGSSEDLGETEVGLQVGHSRNFTLSPETTECDSNCGDLDSEMSLMMMDNELLPASGLLGSVGDLGNNSDSLRIYTSMPVLEDGLSSGHASDTDNNNPTVMLMKRQINDLEKEIIQRTRNDMLGTDNNDNAHDVNLRLQNASPELFITKKENSYDMTSELQLDGLDPLGTPPPPAPQSRQGVGLDQQQVNAVGGVEVEAAIKDIRMALQRTKILPVKSPSEEPPEPSVSPIWIPSLFNSRRRICTESNSEDSEARRNADDADLEAEEAADEEEADTDLETDRLLGQQRTDDHGFYDDKGWRKPKTRTLLPSSLSTERTKLQSTKPTTPTSKPTLTSSGHEPLSQQDPTSPGSPVHQASSNLDSSTKSPERDDTGNSPSQKSNGGASAGPASSPNSASKNSPSSPKSLKDSVSKVKKDKEGKKKSRNKEVLIEGVLFRARYLGSTQLACEGQPTKSTRMCQAEEAVSRIKALAPDGESQPSTEVDLFISTEKIMVLNTDLKEIMMDHALRTISYIADIGDLVVLMARRRFVPHEMDEAPKNRTPKMICHVFESEEAQFIAQSIGQAFQVAYMEFLKANGIEDHSFVKEMDYQEVLNSQEIFGDELQMFAKKEMQKEVVVPKAKGEILGVVIVESGWGSMLPTVVIANLAPSGAAARCGQLNIGDQIIAINGVSLVGLPLSTCQTYIKNSKNQTVVKLTVVPCAPVVEVKIKRPDTKYQLGFSVQNGVICSLLRGGIAERGGVRVGHRIIEINNQSVVAVPHEKIVNLLATSVGEILMKTMPTSMFRLLTGQETPVYI